MAMTSCRECGKPISTKATSCPNCGHKPEKDKLGCAQVIVILFVCIVAALVAVTCATPRTPNTPVSAADQQRFNEEVGALIYLRDRMKNPASFELVSFIRTPADTLCITYRGTNGFNAITTERYTLSNTVSSSSADAWAAHCAGRSGKDVSKAKYALP